ncbi:hypothetical protein [Paraburkholderia xenovorans]|jgi:hypothetical protein
MNADLVGTVVLRTFAVMGVAVAFMPAIARSRVRFGFTSCLALAAVLIWFRP